MIYCFLLYTKVSYYVHAPNIKNSYSLPLGFFFLSWFWTKPFFIQLNCSTLSEEMVSEADYEIRVPPQELQCVDINLQSFWSN